MEELDEGELLVVTFLVPACFLPDTHVDFDVLLSTLEVFSGFF